MLDGFIRLGLGCNLCHYRLARQTLGQTTTHSAGQQYFNPIQRMRCIAVAVMKRLVLAQVEQGFVGNDTVFDGVDPESPAESGLPKQTGISTDGYQSCWGVITAAW